jgi:uncharacterized OsmC-like protein
VSIAEAVQRASAYLTEHPDEARYRDSAAVARVIEGLAVEVTGPGGETLRTDMPKGIGGTASVPSPGWYFRAAAAACIASLIAVRAAATGAELGDVAVEVDSESDDRGILGVGEDVPAGPLSMKVAVTVGAGTTPEVEALVRWAIAHCPVSDAVQRPVPLEVEIGG